MSLFRTRSELRAPPAPGPAPALQEAPELAERPPAPSQASGRFLAIFGAKGYGKTTYLRQLWWARRRRRGSGVFVDPKGENGDMGEVVASPEALQELVHRRAREGTPFSAVVQPGWAGELEPYWPGIFRAGHLLLALDEAQEAADLNQSTRAGALRIIGMGRSRGIDIATTVRTPPEVHKQFRGNLDTVVTFRQFEPDYAELLARKYFASLPSAAARIQALPRYHFLRFDGSRVTAGNLQI